MRASLSVFALLLAIGGCASWERTPTPDYRISLVPAADGKMMAVSAPCPDWRTHNLGAFQNDPWPQYGCASARNLAVMLDQPADLVAGRPMEHANAETTSAAMERYITGKTMPLMDPSAAAPQNASSGGSGATGGSAIGAAVAGGLGGGSP